MTALTAITAAIATLVAAPVASVAVLPTIGVPPAAPALRQGVDDAGQRAVAADVVDGALSRARREGLRCYPSVLDCAARLGAFAGFDFVVVAAVDPAIDSAVAPAAAPGARRGRQATVTLVDCAAGRVVRAAKATLGDDDAAVARGLRALARAATGGATATGELVVRATGADGPVVRIDDVPRGMAPFTLSLPAGAHAVEVGGRALQVDVPVESTVVVDVAAVGAVGAGGAWATAGLVGAAAGVALAVGGLAGAVVVAPDPATRATRTARDYNDAVQAGRALLVVGGAGVALAVAGLGLWAGDPG